MSYKSTFHYARLAAQAEQRILATLDAILREQPAQERSKTDLRKSARSRQGQDSSG
ncbi:MAG: hypothetical protein N3B12_03175 [Armatimonadetes bacterium]|nr:hypothetical protein [Armatimonadota bacterium]